MRPNVVYYRVSTVRQGRFGPGLDAQRQVVTSYFASDADSLLADLAEIRSGKRRDRPEDRAALVLCRIHRGHLVIDRFDRLGIIQLRVRQLDDWDFGQPRLARACR